MFYADLTSGIGSEQSGFRPILIISNNKGNARSNTVIIAIITSQMINKAKIPTHYPIQAQQGLSQDLLVLLEQIRTVDKRRLKKYIGTLDSETMGKIDMALAVSVGTVNITYWLEERRKNAAVNK